MMRRFWFFACLMTLAGCTTMGKMADVMMDPDIQVGSNDEQPSTLGFSLLAERDVNPNESGEAEVTPESARGAAAAAAVGGAAAVPRVGRNDPCPCGSGKKYKQCHGKLA